MRNLYQSEIESAHRALDEVFREYGNRATSRDYLEAARYILQSRRTVNAAAAEELRARRATMWNLARESGVLDRPGGRDFMAVMSRRLRADYGRAGFGSRQYTRATPEALRREIAGYQRAAEWRRSPEHARRMDALPCGLQDADSSRAWEDSVMLRLCRIMLNLIRKGV